MKMFNWLKKAVRPLSKISRSARARLEVEVLESRIVPYAVSGNAWMHPELITISFVPDGTNIDGLSSNLQSTFNTKFGSAATWQNVFKKAAQAWAEQTNINVFFVSDNGDPIGSGSYQEGDPNFGDIRIGGYNYNDTSILASADMPPPANNSSYAGDITFNTGVAFNIGSTFDLFTVASHEFGHALGLYHGAIGAIMSASYPGTLTALATDDINGIRNIYSANAARAQDSYDAAASNDTFATASDITSTINGTSQTALIANMDLSTRTDVDWYKFTVPTGSTTTLTAQAVATGLSMLDPKIDIYNSSNVLKATNNGAAWGSTASASFTGIASGQVWYVKVSSTDSTGQFKTGRYALVLNMGTGANPTVTLPNTQVANGVPLTIGGGQAISYAPETIVNTTTAGDQTTANARPAMAVAGNGNYVVVWSSQNQDASLSWGVYAQLFNSAGVAQGSEFLVNTTTAGDQMSPSVAMAANGDFVVSWASFNQDASLSWGVYAQRFSANGVAQGSEFLVNTTTVGDQTSPSVAMAANGDFVVTWASFNQDAPLSWGIYAQLFNASGVAQGSEFRINSTLVGDQTSPSVAMGANGDFIVTWSSFNQDALLSWGVYAQRFNSAGVAQGSEFRMNSTTAGDQNDATVAMAANGTFVAAWTSTGQDGSGMGVYAQRYDATGARLGGEFLVNTTTAGDQTTPSVTSDNYGGFIVTWASQGQDGSGWGIYGQQFGSSGTPLEVEFGINTTTVGDQAAPAVVMDTLGHLTVVWSGNGTGDTQGVFARRYSVDTDLDTAPAVMPNTHRMAGAFPSKAGSLTANELANFWYHGTFSTPYLALTDNPVGTAATTAREAYFAHGANKSESTSFFQNHDLSNKKAPSDFFARLSASPVHEDGTSDFAE